jgi:glutamate dehydrogenase/leucine dehydrogenase
VKQLLPHIGPDNDIPAPDVNTNAQIIDWMVHEYEQQTGDTSKASFTGKSIANGGSLGRDAATGRGGMIVLRQLLKRLNKTDEITMAVQGFGNVGSFFAVEAEVDQPNWRLIVATDSSGGPISTDGLSAIKVDEFKKKQGRLKDYDAEIVTNDQLIASDVDVLVLAALGDVITHENMDQVKADIILELANGPVSDEAHEYLTKKGILVVPDIIANAGGVVVSYFEWCQNKQNEQWSKDTVNQKLDEYLTNATNEMYDSSQKDTLSLKDAAFAIAIRRILHAKDGKNT